MSIWLLICLFGCKKEEFVYIPPPPPIPSPPVSFLALGDSYTIGENVKEKHRWPNLLADSLALRAIPLTPLRYVARTGWTTGDLLNTLSDRQLADTFDLVSLLIGVDNQYNGFPYLVYEREFVILLDSAVTYAGGDPDKVIVLSIPDYGVTEVGRFLGEEKISEEIDQYNDFARQVCKERGITFFDITPISREAKTKPELISSDGHHPSALMYRRWVSFILDDMLEKLD